MNWPNKNIVMEKVFEDMMKYLSTASKKQLREDWENLKEFNNYGPLMGEMLEDAIRRNEASHAEAQDNRKKKK